MKIHEGLTGQQIVQRRIYFLDIAVLSIVCLSGLAVFVVAVIGLFQ